MAKPDYEEELATGPLHAARVVRGVEDCLVYLVGKGSDDPRVVRVCEVWKSKEAHDSSLSLPEVRTLIADALLLLEVRPSGTRGTSSAGRAHPAKPSKKTRIEPGVGRLGLP